MESANFFESIAEQSESRNQITERQFDGPWAPDSSDQRLRRASCGFRGQGGPGTQDPTLRTCTRCVTERGSVRWFWDFSPSPSSTVANTVIDSTERPAFIIPHDYLTRPGNGFKHLESKQSHPSQNQGGYHFQNPTRYYRRDPGPPGRRFRPGIPPNMRYRIKIVGSSMPAPPLPHRSLHLEG